MKEKINSKSVIAGLVVLVSGILLSIADLTWWHLPSSWGLSVGCSLIASSLVILLTALFVERKKFSALDEWNIEKIYSTRAEKNAESDPQLKNAKYCVDAVAFGLNSFRSTHDKDVSNCLQRGVNFRILTMNPNSEYVRKRAVEENQVEDQIKNTIERLVDWANEKNKASRKGKVLVKGYSSMTLDFYWRVDDDLYIGPYWYGVDSQQTITYKFHSGGRGFELYSDYFERLWDNDKLCEFLTEEKELRQKGRKHL